MGSKTQNQNRNKNKISIMTTKNYERTDRKSAISQCKTVMEALLPGKVISLYCRHYSADYPATGSNPVAASKRIEGIR
jgi:hypothetical protein